MARNLESGALADRLLRLSKALEERTVGRQMLAEAEKTVEQLTREIRGSHPLLKLIFDNGGQPVVKRGKVKISAPVQAPLLPGIIPVKRQRRSPATRRPMEKRGDWEPRALQYLQNKQIALRVSEIAADLNTPDTVMYARLTALANEKKIQRIRESGTRTIWWKAVSA